MTFNETLNAGIADLMAHGYDSEARLDRWLKELAIAAKRSLIPEMKLQEMLSARLKTVFRHEMRDLTNRYQVLGQFTLGNIRPKLHAELDRRIVASASLIRLNRDASIQRTLQRFAGWATSVPKGGSEVGSRKEVKKTVRRAIAGLPFEERRVVIDQGHKLVAAINDIVAIDGGAIAAIWRHVPERRPAYDARPEHVARDKKVYLVRESWAKQDGLVKAGSVGYTDEITQPAEEPFCRCSWQFLFSLRDLPTDMVTAKGKQALLEARKTLRSVANA